MSATAITNPTTPSAKENLMRTPRRRALMATATLSVGALAATLAAATPAVAAPVGASFLAPYYTELDLTGDDQVSAADLEVVAANLGLTSSDAGWADLAVADTDGDGVLTVSDVASLSQRILYDDGPFELVEASVVEMQSAMNAGVVTSVELTQAYLDRIAAYDDVKVDPAANGRALNSIITVSSSALTAAAAADATRASQGMTSMLLGVPIAVKDNYNTVDMPTTGGCACWDTNQTTSDASMIEGLRADGAIILAKASLDEFAFGFVSEYSSFQAASTSTLVASPYFTSLTAGGSSGGTGAAISANLAGIGFGTDTGGSIRVPSSYNQLVGIRPTVGLASRDGIIPLALSQDTGGPMARSVIDATVALDAVVGADAADPVTARQDGKVPASYTSYLDADSLAGARIGYVASMVSPNVTSLRLWNEAKARMEAAGATVVEIPAPAGFAAVLNEGSGSTNEFKRDLNLYIEEYLAPAVTARSLEGIVASNAFVPSRRSTYVSRNAVTPETYELWAGANGTHTNQLAAGKVLLTSMFDSNQLDAIIYPSGTPYGTFSTNMRLSPNTGLPAVSVPMGQASASETRAGAGVNLEFLGRDFGEGDILGLAYAFEQLTQARTAPTLYPALD